MIRTNLMNFIHWFRICATIQVYMFHTKCVHFHNPRSLFLERTINSTIITSTCISYSIWPARYRAEKLRRECVVYWYSFSNPRTKCIHCDNCLVIKKKCVLSFSLRSLRIYPPGCWHRSVPITLIPPPFQPIRAGSGDMY